MSLPARPTPKDLGAYYTPDAIADVLADWVVQTGTEVLLEPSIGSGALLRAALACADRRMVERSRLRLIGYDVDAEAIAGVRGWLSPEHILFRGDFLEVAPDVTGLVHGVISNPPFTRNHDLPKPQRDALRQRFAIKGAAGLWVAFLLHAVGFLKPGGRLAAVVPAAALFSAYGRDALTRICAQFAHVELRQIVNQPVWSSRADERGSIILARGYAAGSCPQPTATRWSAAGVQHADPPQDDPACFRQAQLSARRLGDVATLSIGAVTGFNKVFLLSEAERVAAGIDIADVSLIAARSRHVPGLGISADDLRTLAAKGERTWLLTPRDLARSRRGVRNQLAKISARKRRTVVWLNKRSPWWKVNTGQVCDAIFTYMNDSGPRIVIATREVRCTNTLHQLRFSPDMSHDDRLTVALSMVSSFGHLAGERTGRSYGGGVLKFELSEARRFPVLLRRETPADAAFENAERAIRSGNPDEARRIADALLLPPIFGPSWESAAAEMMAAAMRLRVARRVGSGS